MKKILITGITGQDGLFLSSLLLKEHSKVSILGLTRNNSNSFFENLGKIYDKRHDNIKLIKVDYENKFEISSLIKSFSPDSVYNFMGPSSVYESILRPANREMITSGFNTIIEALIESRNFCNFFQASSSEMFNTSKLPLNEKSQMKTRSPYAEAKLQNHLYVQKCFEKYDWNITSGIMFNHESEFRSKNYLIMKIVNTAIEIARGNSKVLEIGTIEYIRDWSFAGDVVNAAYLINTKGTQPSYVIGSGVGTSIEFILNYIFSNLGLKWEEHTNVNPSLLRKGDSKIIISDPKKLKKEFNWEPSYDISNLLDRCITAKMN
jgi:GDPmannose 4,6-dehydratase